MERDFGALDEKEAKARSNINNSVGRAMWRMPASPAVSARALARGVSTSIERLEECARNFKA